MRARTFVCAYVCVHDRRCLHRPCGCTIFCPPSFLRRSMPLPSLLFCSFGTKMFLASSAKTWLGMQHLKIYFFFYEKKKKKILTNKEMISLQSFVEYNADIRIKELIVEELTLLFLRIQILLHNSRVLYRNIFIAFLPSSLFSGVNYNE